MAEHGSNRDGGSPGLLRMLASVIRRPFYENVARERRARMEATSLESATAAVEETVRAMQPEDEGLISALGGSPRKPGQEEVATLREQAQWAAFRDPLLRGYLRSLTRFVMGKGVRVTAQVEGDEALSERINEWLTSFRRFNKWDRLEDEIPERSWRDGESFIRRFTQVRDGPLPINLTQSQRQRLQELGAEPDEFGGPDVPRGMTLLRMLDPDQIRDPKGIFESGVVTSKDDAQTVLGYIWQPDETKADAEFISADAMEHVKIGVDSDVLRGRSIFEPLLKKSKQYETWLQARIVLSTVRSSVYLFKKIFGTRAQGQSIRDQEEKEQTSTNEQKVRKPPPGSTVHHGPGIEYEFKAPQLQAQDVQHDGRSILLNMSAETGLPEFMFSGDSSNANFSSTLVSEGPAFREFESWQDAFSETFRRLHYWAIEGAAMAQAIRGLTEENLEDVELIVRYPNIEVRDEKQHSEANEVKHRAGVLSKQTWAEDEGLEWTTEQDRLEQERQEEIDFVAPPPEPGGE